MKIKNLIKSYGENTVISNFSAEFKQDSVTLITGESGIGKTTLIRLIAGLEKADGGCIENAGRVSVLFQEDRLFAHLTALENIKIVSEENAEELLNAVLLGDDADKRPKELSGGMSRRVSIARALVYKADTYIFDEPMKGLDAALKDKLARLIIEKTRGKRVIIVTHEPDDFAFCKTERITL